MSRFATSRNIRYTTPQSICEVSVCTHHEAKTSNGYPLEVAHQSHASRRPTAGNISNVFGFRRRTSLYCHLPRRITQLLSTWQIKVSRLALTCVKISLSRKNKGSHFSLAESRKRVYNMSVSKSINEKRGIGVSSTNPRTSHNLLKRSRVMSFTASVYHAMSRQCHEESLKVWGVSS